jgi:ribosomal protein L40E
VKIKGIFTMKICPSCNTQNEDSATECIDCKTKFLIQSSSDNNTIIVGVVLAIIGIGLMLYGNSQNNNLGAQLNSLFGSGQSNPGTPYMIFGGVAIGIGVILILIKMVNKK